MKLYVIYHRKAKVYSKGGRSLVYYNENTTLINKHYWGPLEVAYLYRRRSDAQTLITKARKYPFTKEQWKDCIIEELEVEVIVPEFEEEQLEFNLDE